MFLYLKKKNTPWEKCGYFFFFNVFLPELVWMQQFMNHRLLNYLLSLRSWQRKNVCEDTKMVIRSRKSKDRQYNDQKKKKNKRTNNDVQNITEKTKDWPTQTSLITIEVKCGTVKVNIISSPPLVVLLVIIMYIWCQLVITNILEYDWLIYKTRLGVILGGIWDYSTSFRVIIINTMVIDHEM